MQQKSKFTPARDRTYNHTRTTHYTLHYHETKEGRLVKCYHACKSVLGSYGFWVGTIVSWPIEHYLYAKVWPFKLLSKFMGIE